MNYCLIKDAWGEDFCDSTKQENTYHIFQKPLEYIKKTTIDEKHNISLENIQANNIDSDYFVYDLNNDYKSNNLQNDLDKKDKNDRKQYTYWYNKNKNDLEQQVLINDKLRKNIKNVLNTKKKYNKELNNKKKNNKKTGGNSKKIMYLSRGGNLLDFNKFYTVDYILLGVILIFIIDIFYEINPK